MEVEDVQDVIKNYGVETEVSGSLSGVLRAQRLCCPRDWQIFCPNHSFSNQVRMNFRSALHADRLASCFLYQG